MSTETPNHIIAIGASAGGMEEINTFFDYIPLLFQRRMETAMLQLVMQNKAFITSKELQHFFSSSPCLHQ